jgi:hypothetical protein
VIFVTLSSAAAEQPQSKLTKPTILNGEVVECCEERSQSPRRAAKPIRQPQRETTPRNYDSARTVALERPAWTGRKLAKIKKIKKIKVDADTQNRPPADENKRDTHLPLQ